MHQPVFEVLCKEDPPKINRGPTVTASHSDIWDGADLQKIRDRIAKLVDDEGNRSIVIDISNVKYLPTGFFAVLINRVDEGVNVFLRNPEPNVQEFQWFTQFCSNGSGDGHYQLHNN